MKPINGRYFYYFYVEGILDECIIGRLCLFICMLCIQNYYVHFDEV